MTKSFDKKLKNEFYSFALFKEITKEIEFILDFNLNISFHRNIDIQLELNELDNVTNNN